MNTAEKYLRGPSKTNPNKSLAARRLGAVPSAAMTREHSGLTSLASIAGVGRVRAIFRGMLATTFLFVCGTSGATEVVTYYYTDAQGTPLATADAQGNITSTADYRPYGVQALGQSYDGPGYTGHVNDADTGFVYMQARYYDPENGRFVSVDPSGVVSGDVKLFNRYMYVDGNPVSGTDPDGRISELDCEIYRCQESYSSSGTGGMPNGTPRQYRALFQGHSSSSREPQMRAVAAYFHIIIPDEIKFVPTDNQDYNASIKPDGTLFVSSAILDNSFGLIGAILSHEIEGHWDLQYTQGNMYGPADQGYMREVQAYDLEISNKQRFGLTPTEVGGEQRKRMKYYNALPASDKSLIDKHGIYKPYGL
jgi:RHS repeat-associated protein